MALRRTARSVPIRARRGGSNHPPGPL